MDKDNAGASLSIGKICLVRRRCFDVSIDIRIDFMHPQVNQFRFASSATQVGLLSVLSTRRILSYFLNTTVVIYICSYVHTYIRSFFLLYASRIDLFSPVLSVENDLMTQY